MIVRVNTVKRAKILVTDFKRDILTLKKKMIPPTGEEAIELQIYENNHNNPAQSLYAKRHQRNSEGITYLLAVFYIDA